MQTNNYSNATNVKPVRDYSFVAIDDVITVDSQALSKCMVRNVISQSWSLSPLGVYTTTSY